MKLLSSFAVTTLLLAVSAGGLLAQKPTKNVLGKGDAEFARGLLRYGYTDLATELCTLILESKSTDTVGIEALQLEMKLEEAKREADAGKRKDILIENLKAREAFAKKYPTSKEAGEIRIGMPDLYRRLGETLGAALKDAPPDVIKSVREEGGKIFTQAEATFAAQMEALKDNRDTEDKQLQFMESFYNLARTYYFHSMLEPKGSYEKTKLIEKAIEKFQEFDLEFGDNLINFEGYIYQGVAYKDLEKMDEAIEAFQGAIDLRDRFGAKDAKGVYKVNAPEALEIICAAYVQKVILFTEQKNYEKAIATAKEYLTTLPNPLEVSNGPQLLYVLAKAHQAAGDSDNAKATVQQIIQKDPSSGWASLARALLAELVIGGPSSSGTLDPRQYINLAVAAFENGQTSQAIQLCHRAIAVAKGGEKEAEIGLDAYLTIGAMFAKSKWFHEASLAFDVAAEKYAAAPNAGDALWRAIQCYMSIQGEEKLAIYKKRIDQRRDSFVAKYPKHPNASDVQFIEATQALAQREYVKAAELFGKVPEGSRSYHDAQMRAAEAYVQYARSLLREKKPDEAKKHLATAEAMLKKSRAEIPAVKKNNVDAQFEERLSNIEFRERTLLADIYLMGDGKKGSERAGEVAAVFEGLDPKVAAEPENATLLWRYQIRALEAQGKIDDAVGLFEGWLQKKPDDKTASGPAGLLASALDELAVELEKKNDKRGAEERFRKAIRFYELKLKPQISGALPMGPEDRKLVNRVFFIALKFNNVPDKVDSFVDVGKLELKEKVLLQKAADLFEVYLKSNPSTDATVTLARIHGFLKQWRESAEIYSKLFDDPSNAIVDRTAGTLRTDLLSAKPILLPAYLEWGVAQRELALTQRANPDRFKAEEQRAIDILSRISANTQIKESKIWWQSRYYLIRTLVDGGNFPKAEIAIRDLDRNYPNFEGDKYGLKAAFEQLRTELKK